MSEELVIKYIEDDAIEFTRRFNDLNQLFKTIPNNDSGYIINGINIIASSKDGLIFHPMGEILDTKKQKLLYESFSETEIQIYVEDGTEFYRWYNDNKKAISEVEISSNRLLISSTVDSIEFTMDAHKYTNIVESFNVIVDNINNSEEVLVDKDIPFEALDKIRNYSDSSRIIIYNEERDLLCSDTTGYIDVVNNMSELDDSDNLNHIITTVTILKKYIMKFLKSSIYQGSLFKLLDNVFIFELNIEIKNSFKLTQYFKVVKLV